MDFVHLRYISSVIHILHPSYKTDFLTILLIFFFYFISIILLFNFLFVCLNIVRENKWWNIIIIIKYLHNLIFITITTTIGLSPFHYSKKSTKIYFFEFARKPSLVTDFGVNILFASFGNPFPGYNYDCILKASRSERMSIKLGNNSYKIIIFSIWLVI